MQRAPNYESPRCSVPQAAEQHRQHEIDVRPSRAAAVATERDVQIVAQPGAEADVPPLPEIAGNSC